MGFGALAIVVVVGLLGSLVALPPRLGVPPTVGQLLLGVVFGATGFGVLDAGDTTFAFLADVGFLLVMFVAGTHVPVRDPRLRSLVGRAAARAVLVGVLAVPTGLAVAAAFGSTHGWLYAVLLASSSAALVLPVLGDTQGAGSDVLGVLPQIAIADAMCIVLLPLALEPDRAGSAAVGALALGGVALVTYLVLRWFERSGRRREVHELSERRRLVVELRAVLVMLLGMGFLAERLHVSVMLAGFLTGLVVVAVGEPRRVAKQTFALTDGFFAPLFFVWLGASLNLRGLLSHPAQIGLGLALGLCALAVHSAAGRATGQPLRLAALTAGQLGVPVGAAALGAQRHVLDAGEGAALLLGALVTVVAVSLVARTVVPTDGEARVRLGKPN